MVGNYYDFGAVPHLRLGPKLALKYPNCAWAAHIMSHQDVCVYPNVVPGLNPPLAGSTGQDFLCERHSNDASVRQSDYRCPRISATWNVRTARLRAAQILSSRVS